MKLLFLSQDTVGGSKIANESLVNELIGQFPKLLIKMYVPQLPNFSSPFKFTKRFIWLFISFFRFLSTIDFQRFDVVMSTSVPAILALLLRNSRLHFVYLFHGEKFRKVKAKRLSNFGVIDILHFIYSMFFYNHFVKSVNKYALHQARKLITFSDSAAAYLCDTYRIDPNRVAVVSQGVDHAIFFPVSKTKRHLLRKNLGLKQNQKVVLYTGRLDPYRGIHHLIDAIKLLEPDEPDMILLLACITERADPVYTSQIRNQAKTALGDRAMFFINLPHDKRLAEVYAVSNCVVRASSPGTEVAPLVLFESLACGTPFIGTKEGNIPDILRQIDPKLILSGNRPQTIAYSLRYLFSLDNQEITKIRQKGIAIVGEYNWERTAKEFMASIRS